MEAHEGTYDCIIIGAGYSGLAAAKHLTDNEPSRRVLVLEARDRVGGKAWTKRHEDGRYYDIGAAFLGARHEMMYALAKEYGVETHRMPSKGKLIFNLDGEGKPYSGLIPPIGLANVAKAGVFMARLERKVAKIDPAAPWAHPKAAKWDNVTARDWIEKRTSSKVVRDTLEMAFGSNLARPTNEYSLLFCLMFFKSLGSVDEACTSVGGLQHDLMRGGGMALAMKMYEALRTKATFKLGEPVFGIDYREEDGEGMTTVTTSKEVYKGKRVIFALPPHLAANINFNPPLPTQKMKLVQGMQAGGMMKVTTTYDTPFWRKKGLRGECTSIHGTVAVTFDVGLPDPGAEGQIFSFLIGDKCRAWRDLNDEQRKQVIVKELAVLLGEEALKPKEVLWDESLLREEWSAGCPLSKPTPGLLSEVGEWLRRPVEAVHWAGAETSERHYGHMEGAVTAGRRAAEEVLEALRQEKELATASKG